MKKLSALLAFVFACSAHGQVPALNSSPDTRADRTDTWLLAANALTRGLDVYSTHLSLQAGNREAFLPMAIAGHVPVMAAYSGGIVALNWLASRALERRGHRKLARMLTVIDIGSTAPWVVQNFRISP